VCDRGPPIGEKIFAVLAKFSADSVKLSLQRSGEIDPLVRAVRQQERQPLDNSVDPRHLRARASRVWNGAVDRRPAIVAFCEQPEDGQAAVRAARRHELPLSVRGGGHHWSGPALCSAIVVDGRPPLPPHIRQWVGDSRGHWEGNMLVIRLLLPGFRDAIQRLRPQATSVENPRTSDSSTPPQQPEMQE
jgi:hypothetical protein